MFTGLIEHTGRVVRMDRAPGSNTAPDAPPHSHPDAPGDTQIARLVIDPDGWDHQPAVGDSIAINGCCLTVAAIDSEPGSAFWGFDAVPETLAKTTLGSFEPGRRVHLEHAARADTLMGGHIVQGHVDGMGEVLSVQRGNDWRLRVRAPEDVVRCTVPKGSIAIDGVSLTVAAMDTQAGWLEVALIPVTLAKTALDALEPGDRVNLEADVMTRAIVRHLEHAMPVLLERLAQGVSPR